MNSRSIFFHGMLVIWFCSTPGLNAQWVKAVGLPGGGIRDFCSIDSNLFLAMDGRIFHSDDDGASWTAIASPRKDLEVYSLEALDGAILAGTPEGVYQSSIKSASWTMFNRPGLPNFPALSIWTYLGYLYIGSEGSVYRSIDQGATWAESESGIPRDARITCFAGIVKITVAGSENRGIFITESKDWIPTYSGGAKNPIRDLAVFGTKVYAVTDQEVLESGNLGAEWGPSTLPLRNITSLLGDGSCLYAGTDRGIGFSADKGKTWNTLKQGIPENTAILSLEKLGGSIFASTGSDVWRITSASAGTPDLASGNSLLPPRLLSSRPSSRSLIEFTLPYDDEVDINLLNLLGRTVWSLEHLQVKQGRRTLSLNTGSFAQGEYVLQVNSRKGLAARFFKSRSN